MSEQAVQGSASKALAESPAEALAESPAEALAESPAEEAIDVASDHQAYFAPVQETQSGRATCQSKGYPAYEARL